MAGHSKFKNIMHRKGAQDRLRAKLFSRISKEISVAVKLAGKEIDTNPRLRTAINNGRSANMPNDNILRAIKKGEGNDPDNNYEEVRYEGYGPSGVSIIIEVMTNNKNRAASEIRTIFSKNGGNLAETGSVSYNFKKYGNIVIENKNLDEKDFFDFAVENGSIEVDSNNNNFSVLCEVTDYHNLIDKFTKKFAQPKEMKIIWHNNNVVEIDYETTKKVFKLINSLEENEDVQNVFSNFHVNDEIINKLKIEEEINAW